MAEALQEPLSESVATLNEGWQSYKPLSECMLALFESSLWTDVTFRCNDQKEDTGDRIHAHKLVLAARSPVFKAMFFGHQNESDEISLEDIKGGEFRVFLRSLYSDDPSLGVDDLMVTIRIGHKYQVMNLVDKCFTYLSERITFDNVCTLLNLAMLYESKTLSEASSKYIDENADDVLESPEFLELSKDSLTYVLKGDTFYAQETKIVLRSVAWAEKRCSSSDGDMVRKTLGEAFYFIRTPAMTLKEFLSCTKRKGYYNISETEDIMEQISKVDGDEMCDDEIICNSTTKRLPRITVIDPYQSLNSETTVSEANASLLLRPKLDVFLQKVQLRKVNIVGFLPNPSYYEGPVKVENLTEIQLECEVKLDGKHITSTIKTISESIPHITIDVPLLLKASNDWYELKVAIAPTNKQLQLKLKVYQSERFERCLTGVPVFIKNEGPCHAIIEKITFENTHHRDT